MTNALGVRYCVWYKYVYLSKHDACAFGVCHKLSFVSDASIHLLCVCQTQRWLSFGHVVQWINGFDSVSIIGMMHLRMILSSILVPGLCSGSSRYLGSSIPVSGFGKLPEKYTPRRFECLWSILYAHNVCFKMVCIWCLLLYDHVCMCKHVHVHVYV